METLLKNFLDPPLLISTELKHIIYDHAVQVVEQIRVYKERA